LTGLFLVFYYTPDSIVAFERVQYIIRDVNYGWIIRITHFNGASIFFIFLYLHFFKGLFISSYRLKFTWGRGLTIFFLVIMEAFIGYVLVWAQIRFWAAVVITRLLRVIPIWGFTLVIWIWGGFTVSGATLKFFFTLHFLLPWVLLVLVLLHLVFLHDTGSTSKIYCHGDYDKIGFFRYFWIKDLINLVYFIFLIRFFLLKPFILGDPEMFIEANYIASPVHIVPEWYFLFAYAILRAIPNKILGVIAMLIRIFIFYIFVFINNYTSILNIFRKFLVTLVLFNRVILSWLGQCIVEDPYVFF